MISLCNWVVTLWTAFCPLRRDSQPVNPTTTKIWSTNGTTSKIRSGIFSETFETWLVKYFRSITELEHQCWVWLLRDMSLEVDWAKRDGLLQYSHIPNCTRFFLRGFLLIDGTRVYGTIEQRLDLLCVGRASSLVQEGRRQKAFMHIACKVSLLTFFNWIVIAVEV